MGVEKISVPAILLSLLAITAFEVHAISLPATPVPVAIPTAAVPATHADFPNNVRQIERLWDRSSVAATDVRPSRLPEWATGMHTDTPSFAPSTTIRICGDGAALPRGSLNRILPSCQRLPEPVTFNHGGSTITALSSLPRLLVLGSVAFLRAGTTPMSTPYVDGVQSYGQNAGSPESGGGFCSSYIFRSAWNSSLQAGQGWWSLYDNPELYLFDDKFMGSDMAPFRGLINGMKDWFTSAKAITDYWRTNPLGQTDYQRRAAATAECRAMQRYFILPSFSAPLGPGNSWITVGGNAFDMEGYCWAMNYAGDNRGALGPDNGAGQSVRQLTHYAIMSILLGNYLQGSYFGWMNPTEQLPGWLRARYSALGIDPSTYNDTYITDKLEVFAVPNGFYVRQYLRPQSDGACEGAGAGGDSDPVSVILDENDFAKESPVEVKFSLDPRHPEDSSMWRCSKAAPLLIHLNQAFDPKAPPSKLSAEDLFGTWSFGGKLSQDGKTKIPWKSGFEAMKTFDVDKNGRLEKSELSLLALWSDGNRNGSIDSGEIESLMTHGIESLSLEPVIETESGDLEVREGFSGKHSDGSAKVGRLVDWFGVSGSSK